MMQHFDDFFMQIKQNIYISKIDALREFLFVKLSGEKMINFGIKIILNIVPGLHALAARVASVDEFVIALSV